jgi:hypothetical protein
VAASNNRRRREAPEGGLFSSVVLRLGTHPGAGAQLPPAGASVPNGKCAPIIFLAR